MSSVWELSTDGVVSVLIAVVIGGLMIAWLFAGRRRTKAVSSLEQMRLSGREADLPSQAAMAPAEPTAVEAPPQSHSPSIPPTDEAPLTLSADRTCETVAPPPPADPPQQSAAGPKPKSTQQASAMSIAAALVRHDKRDLATPSAQRPTPLPRPRDGGPDDLTRIKGIGARLEGLLNNLGCYHYSQIADWTDIEVSWIDSNLRGFEGRASQDNWVDQARSILAAPPSASAERIKRIQ